MEPRYFSAEEVRRAVPMAQAIDAVRAAFVALAAGEFELPLRTVLGGGRFLTMNAHHIPTSSTVVKCVSIDFDRQPTVQGTVTYLALGDARSLVLDATAVTALRTGAASGVATDALAPVGAKRLTLIGLGGQAADQLRAVRAVRPIESVTLVARRREAGIAFRTEHADELTDVEVIVTDDADQAVTCADIVCCATPATSPLFAASAIPDRVHVNAIGAFRLSMRELPDELLADALVVVDQREAALEESGEIHHAIAAGKLGERDLIEIGYVLAARVPLPSRTVFKSVGLAVQDWAIGHALATL